MRAFGHQFLRHVERCRLLLHVVDVSGSEGRDPKEDFRIINEELAKFDPELAKRPMIVAGNKCDLTDDETVEDFRRLWRNRATSLPDYGGDRPRGQPAA